MPKLTPFSSWAFVVLGRAQEDYSFVHYESGLVETEPMNSGWCGNMTHSARAGEITALIRAMEWCFAESSLMPQCFKFDAQSVGFAASGRFGYQVDCVAGRIMRSVSIALDTYLPRTFKWEHVKAHTGVLGNEIVDCLARAVLLDRKHSSLRDLPDYTSYCCGRRAAIEVFWFYFLQLSYTAVLPAVSGNKMSVEGVQVPAGDCNRLPNKMLDATPVAKVQDKQLSISVLTFNVTSLHPKKGTLHAAYLREQLLACGHQIACLQETRARQSQMIVSGSHVRIVSAASGGHGGTEIWLLRQDPKTGTVLAAKDKIRVLFQTHEILIIRVVFRGVDLLVFSAHSPHSGAPGDQVSAFWKELQAQLLKWTAEVPLFIGGIDGNAHFDRSSLPHIGSQGLEGKANLAGDCLRVLLQAIDGFLPSTFDTIHSGHDWTWKSNATGAQARCDYVILPCVWSNAFIETYPQPYVDSGSAGNDHSPLAADIKVSIIRRLASHVSKRFDRKALQECPVHQVEDLFAEAPNVDWSVHVDEHSTILSKWVSDVLVQAFPLQGNRPRKSYISDATWQLRKSRLDVRAALRALQRGMSVFTIGSVIRCWRHRRHLCYDSVSVLFVQVGKAVSCQKQLAGLARQVSLQLRIDRTASLTALAKEATSLTPSRVAAKLRELGIQSRKRPTGISPLPIVCDDHGTPLLNHQDVAEQWRRHFAEQEDGIEISTQQLLERSRMKPPVPQLIPRWEDIPTLQDLESAFRRTAVGKAYFDDDVPGDILARAPAVLAKAFFPLVFKQVALQNEALLYKGGRLIPMYKRGDPRICGNYRSIFVSSVVGKALHSIFRQELGRHFEQVRAPLQIGGIKGQSITQASHSLRLFQSIALRQHESIAILFIDIQNAFYRLTRRHMTPTPGDERSVKDLFDSLGLPDCAYDEFSAMFNEDPALADGDVSPFLQSIFAEFYRDTWFKVEGAKHLTWTRRGSRPGDSFADLCFGYALSRLLKQIEIELLDKFPFVATEWSGICTPFLDPEQTLQKLGPLMPVWADDIALAFRHECPIAMISVASEIASLVLHRLAVAGLQPNLKRGKTEILLDLRGKRAVKARRQLSELEYSLALSTPLISESLQVVFHYKHLGTILERGGGLARDLRQKIGAAHDTMTKFRASLFSNRGLPLEKKVQLFLSMVLSGVTFTSSIWCPRTQRQWNQLEAGFGRLYKRLCICHFGKQALEWSKEKVLVELGMHSVEEIMRLNRLRYLSKLTAVGQPQVWGLLQAERCWIEFVQADMRWLHTFCPEAELPLCTPEEWPHLIAWFSENANAWKRILKRSSCRALAFRKRRYHWQKWHQWIFEHLKAEGAWPEACSVRPNQWFCLKCKMSFGSPAALSVHSFKKHDRVHTARYYITGTQCEACLKHYSSYVSLFNHVKRSLVCLAAYQTKAQVVDPEPGVNSRKANAVQLGIKDPYFQAEGPQQLTTGSSTKDPHYQREASFLKEKWTETCDSGHLSPDEWLEALRKATSDTYLSPEEIQQSFVEWSSHCDFESLGVSIGALPALSLFLERFSFEWLTGMCTTSKECHESVMTMFAEKAVSLEPFRFQRYRVPQYKPAVFAHLFSGRRRPDDLQQCLERLGHMALSIDIIFHKSKGDLCNEDTFAFFVNALRSGFICGFLSGPPCETWSRARGQWPDGAVAARWCSRTLRLMAVALTCGATGIMEHPGEDQSSPYVISVWKTFLVRTLVLFPRCAQIRIFQGYYGALAVKPTDLLVVNATPQTEETFLAARATPLPKGGVIGRGPDGKWRTAVLKEYPALLCAVFAQVLSDSQFPPAEAPELPSHFLDEVQPLFAGFDFEADMGADYGNRHCTV